MEADNLFGSHYYKKTMIENKNKIVFGCLILAVVLIAIFILWPRSDLPSDLSAYQAVFLSDGQVYFGHLESYNSRFFLLTGVYYLKYSNLIQQNSATSDSADKSQNLNLIKLGAEVHGPQSSIYIDKSKVTFIENLKDSSQVVQIMKKSI